MLKQLYSVTIEPYSWLFQTFLSPDDLSDKLPEKMSIGEYFGRALRLAIPYFTVLYSLVIICAAVLTLWSGQVLPSPYPFTKVGLVCVALEFLALLPGFFFRTRFGFILTIALGFPAAAGLGIAILSL